MKKELEKILKDNSSDKELKELAEKELVDLNLNKRSMKKN